MAARYSLRLANESALGPSNVIDLDGTTATMIEYAPAYGDGTADVTEMCRVVLNGSLDTVRATVLQINNLFRQAERAAETRIENPVYIELLRPTSGSDWYRSPLVSGTIELPLGALDLQWPGGSIEATLRWTRAGYWETKAEVLLPLTNSSGSNVTIGLTVWNHDDSDSGHDCYVQLDPPGGDLPTPARLRLQMNFGTSGSTPTGDIYAGHGLRHPVFGQHPRPILEAETGSGGTNVASGAASGGIYRTIAMTTGDTVLSTWSLTGTALASYAGVFVRVMARTMAAPPANTVVRLEVTLKGTLIWSGPAVTLAALQLQELGVLQLPPYLFDDAYTLYGLDLRLAGKNASGATSLQLDYLALLPLSGWRRYSPRGYGIDDGEVLHDIGSSGKLYIENVAGIMAHYTGYGSAIMLRPDRTQRLYFLAQTTTGEAPIDRRMVVSVYCRPRRALP